MDTRQTNILMDLHREWGAEDYQKASWTIIEMEYDDMQDFEDKYGSPSKLTEVVGDIYKVCWFYNGLGVLVHRELADVVIEKIQTVEGVKNSLTAVVSSHWKGGEVALPKQSMLLGHSYFP